MLDAEEAEVFTESEADEMPITLPCLSAIRVPLYPPLAKALCRFIIFKRKCNATLFYIL